jgi:hypothetical protein
MHQESSRGAGRVEGASLKTMVGARRTSPGPDSRLFVFCFTGAFAIGTDQKVSVVVPVVALVPVIWADTVTAGRG